MAIELKRKKFLKELSNLIFFWFFGVAFFTIFRLVFITIFRQKIQHEIGFSEILDVLFMGFRFDCTAVAYFLLLPFLLLLVLAPFNRYRIIVITRKVHQVFFIILSTLICVITINYFKEYGDQFNHFLFLALYDDKKAVMNTILVDFHPILNSLIIILTVIVGLLVFRFFNDKKNIYQVFKKIRFKRSKYVFAFLVLVLFVFGIRGSFSTIPILREYSGISKDNFLNKTIINPFRSLKYAIKDFNRLNEHGNKNPYMDEALFKATFPQDKVTDVLKKTAQGPTIQKPKQIFLVVMESYDSWPLMDKYLPFNFSSQLNSIAKKGTHFSHFLASGNTTIDSFGAIMTNVPNCGINLSHIGTSAAPFETSIFTQFKKLGYETNFYYGGYLSWENIGDLSKYYGVDRIYSGVDGGGKTDTGGWGIEDEKLFNLVMQHTDKDKYSLNIILTTSYHAPYTVDLEAKGFPYKSTDDFPQAMKKYYDGAMNLKELGHLWYGDKAIGDFVRKAEKEFTESIFNFTGDHFGRKFPNSKPNLYEKSSVAYIMYGKSIPKSLNLTPGSHIDIMPTLIEMIAPKGFEYYSFGESMFTKGKNEGIAFDKMIDGNDLYYFPKGANIEKIDLTTFKETSFKRSDLELKHNKLMALAWYYTMKGNDLKTKKSK
ncbi:sulfatase-like hydrolase/transferase [Flavobacterium sp. AS60]|uniref:LTA synthase family protein n=1 Tax=Flavobacterium anseongense TaxID=2910677 RepID=UPI001F2156DE|nr:sulfatase-like hydrolase/transferase [Flavobacterium sp. AS60]MCF6130034.1 sulfatase-like hydrolase/transferase [Flavobacterium sp. AS60]